METNTEKMIKEMYAMDIKRRKIVNEIIKSCVGDYGHVMNLTSRVRSLCDDLDNTCL